MPIRIGKAGKAGKATALNELGRRRDDEGDQDGALEAYAQASAIHPGWSVPWYNAGLIHKYRGEWTASLQANARAVQCEPGNEGALWNLGIAATALGDWTTARRAWRQYGIDIPEGEGPVDYFVGLTPIRVHGDEGTEVVWADRIDPARAILRNVPTPACGHRYGDLVLHDGAPNGYRTLRGQERAVFDELDVLAPSDYSTFEAIVEGASTEEVDAFEKESDDVGMPAENWTDSLRTLCRACSEGHPDESAAHDHAPRRPSLRGEIRLGIAAREAGAARERLEAWTRRVRGLSVVEFNCVLPAAPRH